MEQVPAGSAETRGQGGHQAAATAGMASATAPEEEEGTR